MNKEYSYSGISIFGQYIIPVVTILIFFICIILLHDPRSTPLHSNAEWYIKFAIVGIMFLMFFFFSYRNWLSCYRKAGTKIFFYDDGFLYKVRNIEEQVKFVDIKCIIFSYKHLYIQIESNINTIKICSDLDNFGDLLFELIERMNTLGLSAVYDQDRFDKYITLAASNDKLNKIYYCIWKEHIIFIFIYVLISVFFSIINSFKVLDVLLWIIAGFAWSLFYSVTIYIVIKRISKQNIQIDAFRNNHYNLNVPKRAFRYTSLILLSFVLIISIVCIFINR